MPGMSGYELARHIREQSGSADLILVAMTGFGQPEDRTRALQAGFNHHLVKPADIAHFNPSSRPSMQNTPIAVPGGQRCRTSDLRPLTSAPGTAPSAAKSGYAVRDESWVRLNIAEAASQSGCSGYRGPWPECAPCIFGQGSITRPAKSGEQVSGGGVGPRNRAFGSRPIHGMTPSGNLIQARKIPRSDATIVAGRMDHLSTRGSSQ